MATGLDIAASIVALVDLSGQLLSKGYGFLGQVSRAPSKIRQLLIEVANVNSLLDHLQTVAHEYPQGSTILTSHLEKSATFFECNKVLKQIQRCLDMCQSDPGQPLDNLSRSLRWPFAEKETLELFEKLQHIRADLLLALNIDTSSAVNRLERLMLGNQDESIKSSQKQENTALISWICPKDLSPNVEYTTSILLDRGRLEAKLLQRPEFSDWVSLGKMFWLFGPAGSGKTVLTTAVIAWLRSHHDSIDTPLCYFYCDYRQQDTQQLNNFLMTIVLQLLRRNPDSIRHVRDLFKMKDSDVSRVATHFEYVDLISRMADDLSQVFIVLDALDEAQKLEAWWWALKSLLSLPKKQLKIFITTRQNISIELRLLRGCSHRFDIMDTAREDVEQFITDQVDSLTADHRLEVRDPSLPTRIKREVSLRADGLFLGARLQLELLCGCLDDRAIGDALKQLPTTLYETYDRVLEHIAREHLQNIKDIGVILRWLVCGIRPLTLPELAEAVALDRCTDCLDPGTVATNPRRLVSLLSSLANVQRKDDIEVVTLAHLTIKEYLQSSYLANGKFSMFHVDQAKCEQYLALSCARYLGFNNFRTVFAESSGNEEILNSRPISTRYDRLPKQILNNLCARYPLLTYAASELPRHLRDAFRTEAGIEEIILALTWFLLPEKSGGDWYWLWYEIIFSKLSPYYTLNTTFQPPLLFAICFNLGPCFDILAQGQQTFDWHFSGGVTPLIAAVEHEAVEIVHKMLSSDRIKDVDLAETTKGKLTALHIAAEQGNFAIVSRLLNAGASVHTQTISGTTPFYRAMRSHSIAVVELLYQVGSDVNVQTLHHWTPLIEATANGFSEAVELLLKWDAQDDVVTKQGDTALSMARTINDSKIESLLSAPRSQDHTDVDPRASQIVLPVQSSTQSNEAGSTRLDRAEKHVRTADVHITTSKPICGVRESRQKHRNHRYSSTTSQKTRSVREGNQNGRYRGYHWWCCHCGSGGMSFRMDGCVNHPCSHWRCSKCERYYQAITTTA